MKKSVFLAISLLTLLMVVMGCVGQPSGYGATQAPAGAAPAAPPSTPPAQPAATGMPATGAPPAPPAAMGKNFSLVACWYKGTAVSYYDFGTNTPLVQSFQQGLRVPAVAPIWIMIYGMKADGTPDFVAGGHNIIDVIPGDTGYSDLWQVVLVTVPRSYVPDSITSAGEVAAAGYPKEVTSMYVNCPVVPAGSTIQDGRPLIQGWYRGQKAYYYDFGANDDVAAPIWAMISGYDAEGNPAFVPGQNNIVNVEPGDKGYSAFWQVNLVTVPSTYVANTFKSVDDVMKSGYTITPTTVNVNCPFGSK